MTLTAHDGTLLMHQRKWGKSEIFYPSLRVNLRRRLFRVSMCSEACGGLDVTEKSVRNRFDAAAERLVLVSATDLPELAELHTELQDFAQWASAEGYAEPAAAMTAAASLIESIILEEVPNPAQALETIGKALTAFGAITLDGRTPEEAVFPAELRLAPTPNPAPNEPPQPAASAGPSAFVALDGDPSLLAEFVAEAREHLENADVHLLTLETEPRDKEALNAVFRAFHTIKGVAGFLGLQDIQRLSHEAENLLDRARKQEITLTGACIDVLFSATDLLKRLVDHCERALQSGEPMPAEDLDGILEQLRVGAEGNLTDAGEQPPDEDLHLGELLIDDVLISRSQLDKALETQRSERGKRRLGDILVEAGALAAEDLAAALEKQKRRPAPPLGELLVKHGAASARDVAAALRSQAAIEENAGPSQRGVALHEAVKVDADRLDRLIDLLGELVIAEAMVAQAREVKATASPQLMRHISQLDKITRELQEMGTSLRMIPVRGTFQKMARLVRDLAKKSGKRVDFVMNGEDTELDKSVVDRIGDPLVHMIRNAVDHGIEADAETRRKAGKPETARVELRAFHKGGSIYIEIEDDGRGLCREAILAKAAERGLVRDGETLSDREVWNLIFEAGFSTAKKVTDVSGRGVGMDVVRRNVEALRGQVEIQSEQGKGTVFSIRLPLTLAIIDGMVVRVGAERYIIPTLSVVRAVRPQKESLYTVTGRGEMLSLQGELIPLYRLHQMFRIRGAVEDPTEAIAVVVEDEGQSTGLVVDELLGQQQIVIKSLGQAFQGLLGVAGGAIMSDGQVGLILDVGGIVKIAQTNGHGARPRPSGTEEQEPAFALD